MHALIACIGNRRINLLPQFAIALYLECVRYSTRASIFNIALFEYERSVPRHVLVPSILLALFIHHDIELIYWLNFEAIHFKMHLDDIPCLLGHHIIQLPCEILGWEAEILGQNNMSQNVFSVVPFNSVLVFARKGFIHSARLEENNLIHIVVKLE